MANDTRTAIARFAHRLFGRPVFHWSDTSLAARKERSYLRRAIRMGDYKPKAEDGDAERYPEEYFKCQACETGPWHITWGWVCPNCSGAD